MSLFIMFDVPDSELSIIAKDVTMGYILPDKNVTTLKEALIAIVRGTFFQKKTHNAIKNGTVYAKKGECIALLGHNGSGKSTFLKVIAGILNPKKGEVEVRGSIAPLIELGAGFDPELTGNENIFLSCSLMGLTKKEIEGKYDFIREFSELKDFLHQPVKTYSSGMYMRLAFSCAVAIKAEVMLIDEILAVGDQNFQKKCLSKIYEIRNSGATVVLVSHDTNVVRQLADRVYVMDQGEVIFNGPSDEAIKAYDKRMHERALAVMSEAEQNELERKKELYENSTREKHGEKVSIDKVRIKDANNKQELSTGEAAELVIDIHVKQTMKDKLTIGFAFMKGHLRLTGTNTSFFDVDIQNEGHHSIAFKIPSVPLASGTYSIIAAVHDSKIVECFDIKVDAVKFEVHNPKDIENFDHDLLSPFELVEGVELLSR